MGRRPKPMAAKRQNGSADGDSKARRDEVVAPPGHPEMPEHLDEFGEYAWQDICTLLSDLGALSEADGPLIAIYAEAFSQARQAAETIRKEGATLRRASGSAMEHPACKQREKNQALMVRCLCELGLTPSARPKLGLVGPQNRTEHDRVDWSRYFNPVRP